jgi:hypothetical protein
MSSSIPYIPFSQRISKLMGDFSIYWQNVKTSAYIVTPIQAVVLNFINLCVKMEAEKGIIFIKK